MRALRVAGILAVFFFAVAVGPVAEQGAYAGGGLDNKVTVRNDTNSNMCEVALYLYKSKGVIGYHSVANIPSGLTYTFNAGNKCPIGLGGRLWVFDEDKRDYFPYYFYSDMNGQPVSGETAFTEKSCSDSSWKIIHKGDNKLKGYKFQKN